MIFLLLAGLILAMVLWILLVPLSARINTDLGIYEIVQPGTMALLFDPGEKRLSRIRIFGISLRLGPRKKAPKRERKHKQQRRPLRKSPSQWLYLVKGIYRSCRMKRMICTADLDDVVLNAKLTPLILFLNRGKFNVSTNFDNRYLLDMEVEIRIYRALWTIVVFWVRKQ